MVITSVLTNININVHKLNWLLRNVKEDINKVYMIGAKRIVIYKQLIIVLTGLMLIASIVGVSIGYVVTQVASKIFNWMESIVIIPVIHLETYLSLILLSFVSSSIGAILPIPLILKREVSS